MNKIEQVKKILRKQKYQEDSNDEHKTNFKFANMGT